MVLPPGKPNPSEEQPGWLGFGKMLLLLVFAVVVFLLAQDMVHHHFFSGGALNYHISTRPS